MNGGIEPGEKKPKPVWGLGPIRKAPAPGGGAAAIEYHDFILHLDLDSDGRCEVRVLQSLWGDAEGSFELPVVEQEIANIFRRSEHARDSESGLERGGETGVKDRFRSFGSKLFEALFPGKVRLCWEKSKARLEPGHGLRVKIRLNLEKPESVRLYTLPWEYLFDEGFIGLDLHYPIVRYIELQHPAELPLRPHPLRILLVQSIPDGLTGLPALEEEARAMEEVGEKSGALEVVRLVSATLDAVRKELRNREYHVLHFMGHGDFGQDGGVLFFEDDKGQSVPVRGEDFAVQLRDRSSLRLVFLNACKTARIPQPAPFAGVASALVRTGIPAVVAMQFPVTDKAALMFAKEVYRRIAVGDPVDAAVTEGRLALHRKAPNSMEWGAPALFMRASELFEPLEDANAEEELPLRQRRLILANLSLLALLGLAISFWLYRYTEWLPGVITGLGLGGMLTWIGVLVRVIPERVQKWIVSNLESKVLESPVTWKWWLAVVLVCLGTASLFGTICVNSANEKAGQVDWYVKVLPLSTSGDNRNNPVRSRHLKANSEQKWPLLIGRPYLVQVARDSQILPPKRVQISPFDLEILDIPTDFRRTDLLIIRMAEEQDAKAARGLKIWVNGVQRMLSDYHGEDVWLGKDPPDIPGSISIPYPLKEGECVDVVLTGEGEDFARAKLIFSMPAEEDLIFEIKLGANFQSEGEPCA